MNIQVDRDCSWLGESGLVGGYGWLWVVVEVIGDEGVEQLLTGSKITVVIVVVLVFDFLAGAFFFGVLFVFEVIFSMAGETSLSSGFGIFVLTGITSGIGPIILDFHLLSLQLLDIFKVMLIPQLLLFPQFLELFLSFLQFFFLHLVVGFKFAFKVVKISVFVDVGLLKLCQFLLQSFVFLHKGGFHCN